MSALKVQRRLIGAVMLATLLTACAVLLAAGCSASSRTALTQDESRLAGDWSGESICQVKDSPCRDEKVVYHVSESREAGKVTITADKIVDGRAITMGGGDYEYDKEKGTLRHEDAHGVWLLTVAGDRMEGSLTLPDKTVYRRVTLKKD